MTRQPPANENPGRGHALRRTVFLHIGKTGGTALRAMLRAHFARTGQRPFVILPHSVTLDQAAARYPRAEIGFFIRDPLDRLVSGFLSRQRRGWPRHDIPWTEDEARAFADFDSPDALGRALAADDPRAHAALQAIQHTREGLAHFLGSPETLDHLAPRIGFIGQTERFAADIARLKARFGLAHDLAPPEDAVGAHRNPEPQRARLSPEAAAALRGWLAADYAVYAWCRCRP
ncbi:hypothetical protein U879_18600 [Defluviimonas sp. 20V17]|uniref:Sulfotransferase family protein n=1 Tax=Allgaiera indica TaxID=765699 RepID=A0AAN4UNN5_9RHOB|nr:hypothetical protein [Allgaiera indica]KDB02201.1 hypothetical protein U879_18600 [Defluviimonas sp. 20V17]GHD98839.1 hypothetical protein GCM10008024_03960 [Allgaiera indica]SDW05048.1 hypothetical protein SAMN05444006_101152 [Allgaiera indica]